MLKESRNSVSLLALVLGALSASPAVAQAQPTDQVETVIVTALKTATPLQKTPVAVTALGVAALNEQHVQTIQDLVHLVPSFQGTSQGDHGVITLTLRGIGNDQAKLEYSDPEVTLFVDGLYTARPEGATALLFDLDNIQVLRGPQGTLWGRNSTSGVVNMVTAKPTFDEDISGDAMVGYGNFQKISLRGAVNIPLSKTFAVRFAFAQERHDGYVDYQNPSDVLPSVAAQEANYISANDAQEATALAAMTSACPGSTCAALTTAYNRSVTQDAAAHAGTGGMLGSFQPINVNMFVNAGPKYSSQNQTGLRASFLWAPMDKLTWNLSFEAYLDRGTPQGILLQNPRAGQKLWSALVDTAPYLHRDVYSIRSRIDYSFDDYLEFSYIAGATKFAGSSSYDQDMGATVPHDWTNSDGMWASVHQEDRTAWSHDLSWSHEIQLRSAGTHTVDWLIGGYYGAEQNGMKFDIPLENGTGQGINPGWQGTYYQFDQRVLTLAAFAQATWNVTDQLHLTGGLRYSADSRKNVGGMGYSWNGSCSQYYQEDGVWRARTTGYQSPNFSSSYNVTDPANSSCWGGGSNTGKFTGDKLTWLARVSYDVSDDMMVYASASTGYKSGGTQDGGLTYKPETLYSYEFGTKNTLFDGRMTWNNALFYYDFKDYTLYQAVTDPVTLVRTVKYWSVTGSTRVMGFESELLANLSPDDTVNVTLSVLNAKLGTLAAAASNDYQNLNAVTSNVSQRTMPHAPTLSVGIGYSHDFHLDSGAIVQPRAFMHIETTSWLSWFHDNYAGGHQDEQTGYTRTDLALRYISPGSKWYLEAWAQNVEGSNIKTSAGATGGNVYQSLYLPPRTFGVNLGVNF